MADAPGKQEIGSSINEVDLMQFAAEDGYLVWQHLQEGGEVILINRKTNEMRRLLKTKYGFEVIL